MPKYVIERDIPGAGSVSPEEVRALSEKSNGVLADLGDVQWIHSFVTADKLFCLYIAPSEDRVREHAVRTGIPANSVHEVVGIVDPDNRRRLTAGGPKSWHVGPFPSASNGGGRRSSRRPGVQSGCRG